MLIGIINKTTNIQIDVLNIKCEGFYYLKISDLNFLLGDRDFSNEKFGD